jgi:hypothetical protein
LSQAQDAHLKLTMQLVAEFSSQHGLLGERRHPKVPLFFLSLISVRIHCQDNLPPAFVGHAGQDLSIPSCHTLAP